MQPSPAAFPAHHTATTHSVPQGQPGPASAPAPMPRMKAFTRPVCDIIYFGGPNCEEKHNFNIRKLGYFLGLKVKAVAAHHLTAGIWEEIKSWHRSGELQNGRTLLIYETHGWMANGRHVSAIHENEPPVDTLQLVDASRRAGMEFGLPYFEGCMAFHTCHMGKLREALALVWGAHAIFSGKNLVLTEFASRFQEGLAQLLANAKARGDSAPDATEIFNHLRTITPVTMSISGLNVGSMVQYVRTAQDLAGASEQRIVDAFHQYVRSQKVARVQQHIKDFPWLLTRPLGPHPSTFSYALAYQYIGIAKLILQYDHANWGVERHSLQAVGKAWPECQERVGAILRNLMKEEIARSQPDVFAGVGAKRQALMWAAARHVMSCRDPSVTAADLTVLYAERDRPDYSDDVLEWDLLDLSVQMAATALRLTTKEFPAFWDEVTATLSNALALGGGPTPTPVAIAAPADPNRGGW